MYVSNDGNKFKYDVIKLVKIRVLSPPGHGHGLG